MDPPSLKLPQELINVVWASHILSLRNPHTITASDEALQADQDLSDEEEEEEEENFDDDGPDDDSLSTKADFLTASSDVLRQKFLDCISELLAHTKGGDCVTATALREKEDDVEVDVARNNGLNLEDEAYLGGLKQFLAMQAEDVSHQKRAEFSHAFLDRTIAYSARRVDAQAEAVAKLLKGSPYRPLPHSVSEEETEDNCLLGCCFAPREPIPINAQNLLLDFLNRDFLHSKLPSTEFQDEQRRKIVQLAAATACSEHARQATQSALETMVPSVNPHKAIKMWRVLARPVTCLQILSQIASLLPNFRAVTFIPISPPAPLFLQKREILTIKEAWKRVGLHMVPNGRIPAALVQKNDKFMSRCRSALYTHCEIQLLTRYETQPSLSPTLAYFGCSKKACFLCEKFLTLSPLNIRTRGRHGKCHPRWAVQSCTSESTRQRLRSLCDIVKEKIRARLNGSHTPVPVAIHQSSAVSELRSKHMIELMRQSKNREVADKKAQELREQSQILLNPRSVGPRKIWYADLTTLCIMCQTPRATKCSRCRATSYCSKRCQALDWPAHKLLCSKYPKFLDTRVSQDHRLGIWFPRDTDRPRLIWTPIFSAEYGVHMPYFDPYLGPNHGLYYTIPFAVNKRRGLELDHALTIYYRDWDEVTNKSVHATVEACPGMTVPYNMVGDYVVMSGQWATYTGTSDHEFVDMTLADFRHALDWFSTYFDETIRETPSGGSVLAVKVSCPLEQTIYGRELFSTVAVDRDFPSTSSVSPITQALGFPIRVCKLDQVDLERAIQSLDEESKKGGRTNPYARVLMTDIDVGSDNWGKTQRHWDIEGSVLLRREDAEDLDIAWAKHISCYCLKVLKPLFERALSGEISRQEVMEEITLEKVIAWQPVDDSPGVAAEPNPQRGFVARIGSQRWEFEKQHCPVLRATDEVLRKRAGS